MPRVQELDGLRGLAALVIVVFHLRFVGRVPLMGSAVDLFFVLSGYLITRILLRTAPSLGSYVRFGIRRGFRLWPIYFLSFGLLLVLNPLVPRPGTLEAWPYFLTYTQFTPWYWGVEPPEFSRLYDHTWTLAIEEQFYLIWPLVVFLGGRRGVLAVGALLIPLAILSRGTSLSPHLLLTRCDGLAVGAMVAAWYEKAGLGPGSGVPSRVARCLALLIAIGVTAPWWSTPLASGIVGVFSDLTTLWGPLDIQGLGGSLRIFAITLLYGVGVAWVVGSAGGRRSAWLRHPWLAGLGRISYALYLFHPFVMVAVSLGQQAFGLPGGLLGDGLKLAGSILLAYASWRWVEQPIHRWRERLTRQSSESERPRTASSPCHGEATHLHDQEAAEDGTIRFDPPRGSAKPGSRLRRHATRRADRVEP